MKTKLFSFLLLGLFLLLVSCETVVNKPVEPLKKEIFSGYVQKGPFINGSSVAISELDATLNQTGRSYSTTVADNSGSFEQKKIELVSNYVQLKADGYYFNEVTGESSTGQLTMYALADVSVVNSANVNVLTHLEKSRVEYLVQQKGLAFAAAKKQAQEEVLKIFNLTLPVDSTSESLNLSGTGENNAILLAVSCILQGPLSTADMSQLMANISTDIKTDGTLDNASVGSTLIDNARLISLPSVRQHLEKKYTDLGMANVIIPDFESKVQEFISKTTYTPSKLITYPNKGISGPNILSDSVTSIESFDHTSSTHIFYSMTANLPVGTSLRILLKGSRWYYQGVPAPVNWTVGTYDESKKMQEFTVGNANTPNNIAMLFDAGITTIEYYENGATTPTKIKTLEIKSSPPPPSITFPVSGIGGKNILFKADSIYIGNTYSMAVFVPTGQVFKIRVQGPSITCLTNPASFNWTIGAFNSSMYIQEFIVTQANSLSDLAVRFTSQGEYRVEYYFNNLSISTSETRFTLN